MSGVTMSVVNELCELVTKRAKEHRDYLVKKHEGQTKKLSDSLYADSIKGIKVTKDLETFEAALNEIDALEMLISKKRRDKDKLAHDIIEQIEKSDPKKWEHFGRWGSDESRIEQITEQLKIDAQTQAIYLNSNVGPVVKALDDLIKNVREQILLATSNNAVRAIVAELLARIESLVKIE